MKFEGRIYKVFPVQSGTSSRGNQWRKQDFIFEFFELPTDRYADRVLLSVMNERIDEYNLQEGDKCIVGFGHSVNEYNGRYYNDVRCYHFEKVRQVGKDDPAGAGATAKPSPTENQPTTATPQPTAQPQQQQLFGQQPTAQPTAENTAQPTNEEKADDLPF